jgi:multidrug efflux pump subunit AcrB
MNIIKLAVDQPITIAVAVVLAILAGLVALDRVPVRMSPVVDSVVISVTTNWENASPKEIESDVIEEQERRLGEISGLISMTSISQPGRGQIRLEFRTGTNIGEAMAEVTQRLNEVPSYPEGVDEPEIEDIDPESVDFIAWIGLASTDPEFDASMLFDFMERRVKPRFDRIPGISQVGIVGAREKEVQIRVDPTALSQRGITYAQLVDAIQFSNENFSGGRIPDGKNDIRVRSVGRFRNPQWVANMVIRRDETGPIYLKDVAQIVETEKEMNDWVRARGHVMPFFNFQLEVGGNLLDTMTEIQAEVAKLNAPGGLLEQHARKLGLNGTLELVQTYDASTYVHDALRLVRSNILFGGILAVATLLIFLRFIRTIGIIAIAIPISVVGSVVMLVTMGRSINIISLAGMAFAVGMVVDNSIVVIENIFRHLEMGKSIRRAAIDGTHQVAGAVLASTLTTLIVFVPILLIQESAGQLFRDIALAIMSAVGLSLIVSITVIPSAARRLLGKSKRSAEAAEAETKDEAGKHRGLRKSVAAIVRPFNALSAALRSLPASIGNAVYRLSGRKVVRPVIIGAFAVGTITSVWALLPPMDYLPLGNRNVVFGLLIPPPGYNLDHLMDIGLRMEERLRPYWQASGDRFTVEKVVRNGTPPPEVELASIPVDGKSGAKITPPSLKHYFLVARGGRLFQVAITKEKKKVVDALPLMEFVVQNAPAPDVISFAFQFPLFRTGGTTGSAIKIDVIGDDLETVTPSATAIFMTLLQKFGPRAVTPDPPNFLLPTPELRVVPDDERLRDVGMTRRDVGLAVQANADGILLVREYELGGELKDLKIITPEALGPHPMNAMLRSPISTPTGQVVDLLSLATVERIRVSDRIKHVDRRRGVTLQFTPPPGMPLQNAIDQIANLEKDLRDNGAISPNVEVKLAGSAGKLNSIRRALLGDGTFIGTITSSIFLALLVVYLLMSVLFQNWTYPLVIMVTVPLATLGGFIGLAIVHNWSVIDRYMPVQNLDVLTILGFVILIGVVVNNAILIVHQTLNFLKGGTEEAEDLSGITPREAIAKSVTTRVRPILMSTLTSVGAMMPLVLMPGSGSELYRGLGAVVVGGLLVATLFTMFLVPLVLSVVFDLSQQFGRRKAVEPTPV